MASRCAFLLRVSNGSKIYLLRVIGNRVAREDKEKRNEKNRFGVAAAVLDDPWRTGCSGVYAG